LKEAIKAQKKALRKGEKERKRGKEKKGVFRQ